MLRRTHFLPWILLTVLLCAAPSYAGTVLFDNLNQPSAGTCGTEGGLGCAQRFQTGTDDVTFLGVILPLYQLTPGAASVRLYSDDPTGPIPATVVADLLPDPTTPIPQGGPGAGVVFRSAGLALPKDSVFWVALAGDGDFEWAYTTCPPDGDLSCVEANVPGIADSAVFLPPYVDPDPALSTPGFWILSSGTQQMAAYTPEPATIVLAFAGLALLAVRRRRV